MLKKKRIGQSFIAMTGSRECIKLYTEQFAPGITPPAFTLQEFETFGRTLMCDDNTDDLIKDNIGCIGCLDCSGVIRYSQQMSDQTKLGQALPHGIMKHYKANHRPVYNAFAAYVSDNTTFIPPVQHKTPPWTNRHYKSRVLLQIRSFQDADNIVYQYNPHDAEDIQNMFLRALWTQERLQRKHKKKQSTPKKTFITYQRAEMTNNNMITPTTLQKHLGQVSVDGNEYDTQVNQAAAKKAKRKRKNQEKQDSVQTERLILPPKIPDTVLNNALESLNEQIQNEQMQNVQKQNEQAQNININMDETPNIESPTKRVRKRKRLQNQVERNNADSALSQPSKRMKYHRACNSNKNKKRYVPSSSESDTESYESDLYSQESNCTHAYSRALTKKTVQKVYPNRRDGSKPERFNCIDCNNNIARNRTYGICDECAYPVNCTSCVSKWLDAKEKDKKNQIYESRSQSPSMEGTDTDEEESVLSEIFSDL